MTIYNSTIINTPIEKVWALLTDFHDLQWAKNSVQSYQPEGEHSSREIGARRRLNEAMLHTLQSLDHPSHTITYTTDHGPGPLDPDKMHGYMGTIRLTKVTDGNRTYVEWSSKWSEAEDHDAVVQFVSPIYQGMLEDLKRHFHGDDH